MLSSSGIGERTAWRLNSPFSCSSPPLSSTTASEFEHELHDLMECLQLLLESSRFESSNLDLNLADGVLSVASPVHGTWVLNKHTPTRQIWLSSPVSGPRKYNFHSAVATDSTTRAIGEGWRGERDTNEQLKRRLIAEWSQAFGAKIDPVKDFMREEQH
jgi:frataxin-like iron-binding protein CyaY